jgi:UDP-N-acetylmuramyl pentapeptide phosphotransferase/UDP-N-acetylglucosamine-1-phosphate transferase
MDPSSRWLIEGCVPLLGGAAIFLLIGLGSWLTHGAKDKESFSFAWREALDPLGWLYGAAVLGVQLAWYSLAAKNEILVAVLFGAAAAVCMLVLAVGMLNRGRSAEWRGRPRLSYFAILVVVGILVLGYSTKKRDDPRSNLEDSRGSAFADAGPNR